MINVSWDDAANFCRWLSEATGRSFRLPSEAEWEKAARGSDGRIYPWGNEPPVSLRCNFGDPHGGTTPVRQYPDGVSPCGALDMAGNVWDRTLSWRWAYPYQEGDGRNSPEGSGLRVLRGGSFWNDAQDVRRMNRIRFDQSGRFVVISFDRNAIHHWSSVS